MATHFATIWRNNSALARCKVCGVQRQFHGLSPNPQNAWDRPRDHAFEAVTADDINPADLLTDDLIRHCDQSDARRKQLETGDTSEADQVEANRLYERVEACRIELKARVLSVFGVSWDDLCQTMEG